MTHYLVTGGRDYEWHGFSLTMAKRKAREFSNGRIFQLLGGYSFLRYYVKDGKRLYRQ